MNIEIISFILLSLVLGFFLSRIIENKKILKKKIKAIKQAKKILVDAKIDAENIKKDKFLQAKEHFLELKIKYEKSIHNREQKIKNIQNNISQKEANISREFSKNKSLNIQLKERIQELDERLESIKVRQREVEMTHSMYTKKLEYVASLSAEDAKSELVKTLKEEAKMQAMEYIKNTLEEAKLSAQKDAKKILITTIQRIGAEESVENCVTTFPLESDELKGKIIGREGRNIRAIESATGVEVLVDDTPGAVILSCFDPIRREIARLSLQKLIADGRIHPARIEEVVNKTFKEINEEIIDVGKRTIIDLGIHGLHPELIRIVGRMKYRSSYGQNLLQHSREVANMCSVMAAELGLKPKLAKRAGLLHDIGKVSEEEHELPHALLGMEWAKKYGETPDVINAIGSHHDEIEMTSILSPIVQVCDAISGSRPGIRRQSRESYIQRLKDLESIALGFEGVKKAFAIQAGRELRVMVYGNRVNDHKTSELSYKISEKIQNDMTYPGQIKVTVIRETRAINIAR